MSFMFWTWREAVDKALWAYAKSGDKYKVYRANDSTGWNVTRADSRQG